MEIDTKVNNLTKIHKNYRSIVESGELYTKQALILVATGAFCPIHIMHVKMFEIAKKHLEATNKFIVIGGIISPSHDLYVLPKMKRKGSFAISSKDRVEICRKVLKNHSWVDVDDWEATQTSFVSFVQVVKHYGEVLSSSMKTVKTFKLMGADLLLRAPRSAYSLGKKNGLVCVGRPSHTSDAKKIFGEEDRKKYNIYIIEEETLDISSSNVRDAILKGQSIDELTFPEVNEYLKEHKLLPS